MNVHQMRPFSGFERLLSFRYLRSQRREGFISVIVWFSFIGIMLGVATMITVMAVMNGFRNDLIDKFLGMNGHIIVYPLNSNMPDLTLEGVRSRISSIEGVKAAVSVIEGSVLASSDYAASGALVRALKPDDVLQQKSVVQGIREEVLHDFGSKQGILLGENLSGKLGAFQGNRVTLLAPNGVSTPFGVTPRVVSYEVLGTFRFGVSEYDSALIFMPFEEGKAFFGDKGSSKFIEIMLQNPDEVSLYREKVQQLAGDQFYLVDWQQRNQSLFSALELERNVMFLILAQMVLVAILNIISGLIMLVKDREAEIAILRTMGMTRTAVLRVFLMTGVSVGIVGTLSGLCLGLLVCWKIELVELLLFWLTGTSAFPQELYSLSRLPVDVNVGETVSVVIMSLFFSFVATIYPSWRAASLDPVEILRYE